VKTTDIIKDKLNIVDYVENVVDLAPTGNMLRGLCPFHTEKTASFFVWPDSQTWHCFGCGRGGDIFDFVQEYEGCEFKEALVSLATDAGVELDGEISFPPRVLYDIMWEAGRLMAEWFWTSNKPRTYILETRGVAQGTAQQFGIGYNPPSGRALYDALREKGFEQQDILDTGLANKKQGRIHDLLAGRVVYPLLDVRKRVVAFGGRRLGDYGPKYLNTPTSPIFEKRKHLFGLAQAVPTIRELKQATVVEGYHDVLAAHQHELGNTVATMGTAVTTEHILHLSHWATRIILAMDGDAGGERAVGQAANMLRTNIPKHPEIAQTTVLIAQLPAGQDPDDIIGTPAWIELLDTAQDIVTHLITTRPIGDTPQDKQKFAEEVAPYIRMYESPIARQHYLRVLSEKISLSPAATRSMLHVQRTVRMTPRRTPKPTRDVEQRLFHDFLADPALLPVVNYVLNYLQQPSLSDADFQEKYHSMWELLQEQDATAVQSDTDTALQVCVRALDVRIKSIKRSLQNADAGNVVKLQRDLRTLRRKRRTYKAWLPDMLTDSM